MHTASNRFLPRLHVSQEGSDGTESCQDIQMSAQASGTVYAADGRLGTVCDVPVFSRRYDVTGCRSVPRQPRIRAPAAADSLLMHEDAFGIAAPAAADGTIPAGDACPNSVTMRRNNQILDIQQASVWQPT